MSGKYTSPVDPGSFQFYDDGIPITTVHPDPTCSAGVLVFKYNPDPATALDAKSFGFKKYGFWGVMWFYQSPALGMLDNVKPDEMFGTWQFTK
jgi:hypothetical protein